MRDAFAVLFFVSVGMLLDPAVLMESPWLVLGALGVVLVAKPMVALIFVWVMRHPFGAALTAGVALAQIGEFSFILASMGRSLGVLPAEATNVLVATAITSIVLNPIAYRAIRPIERMVRDNPRLRVLLYRPPVAPADAAGPVRADHPGDPGTRAVVVGYGPSRPHAGTPARRQRHLADGGEDQHGRHPHPARGRGRHRLRRCDAAGDSRGGGRRLRPAA